MIYIVRHGQTDWNILNKVMGKRDISLNETGFEQAKELKEKLDGIDLDLIICSTLLRAKQTAQVINQERGLPIIYDERIVERDFGEFEGMQTKDFDFANFWNYYENIKYDKAENIRDFFSRIYDFFDSVKERYNGKNVLIVTHGCVSMPITCYFNKNIPSGSLLDSNKFFHNGEVRIYDL